LREAPSLVVVPLLQQRGAVVRLTDPQGGPHAGPLLAGVRGCHNALEAAEGADVLVVLTEWNEFRALDLEALRQRMRGEVLVDPRNIFLPREAARAGFHWYRPGKQANWGFDPGARLIIPSIRAGELQCSWTSTCQCRRFSTPNTYPLGAYWLLHSLWRQSPERSKWHRPTVETVRCMFLKIAVHAEEVKTCVESVSHPHVDTRLQARSREPTVDCQGN
jgi:UDP-glucose/GDP-mannose dehydrogenase family, UDP binding domain